MNHKELPKTFAEFFAGIGLMRMGLENAGWNLLFANDIDPAKQSMYEEHFQDETSHFVLGDIHALKGRDIPDVSLATASFPCTDLSLAGRREGLSGSQSSAFWGFIQVLEDMGERRPPMVLLENVEGFLTSHGGKDFKEALLALNELGYAVDSFLVDASRFVPQSRVRLFIVGHQAPNTSVFQEQRSFYQSEVRSEKLANFILLHPEINWSVRDLPPLPRRRYDLSAIVDNTGDDSEEWWNEDRVAYFLNQTSAKHRAVIDHYLPQNDYYYLTAFRRVRNGRSMAEIRADGVAGCLRTPKGGSARQILVKVGKGEVRVRFLSPRECAKLMGAGDYQISCSANQALFGFGDAVCVPVVEWIGKNYLNPLLKELGESLQPASDGVRKQISASI
ncbi:MAG: DNA (cytosine-5-)-methyltransferase [Anaerolineales bacterium]|nr:DNA (cytosine-5-)-methyltransferase [Anaerolineales bacterium]